MPRKCVWEITRRCNLRCIHCENRSGPLSAGELADGRLLEVAEELASLGCHEAVVTGGEPLLRPAWKRVCHALCQRGINVSLVTNGTLLDQATLGEARSVGVGVVGISIDGLQATHDRIRPREAPGRSPWEQTVDALTRCAEALPVVAMTQVNRLNLDELPDLGRLLAELIAGEHLERSPPLRLHAMLSPRHPPRRVRRLRLRPALPGGLHRHAARRPRSPRHEHPLLPSPLEEPIMTPAPCFPTSPALRLRRFLYEQGLRLEPWTTQERILEAFLDHLAHAGHDDRYWEDLTQLTTSLAQELQRRRPESALVQAMNLDCDALMLEIRHAVAASRTEQQGHHSLGKRITGPAMPLLMLVTLVVVACGGQTESDSKLLTKGLATGGTGASAGAGGTGASVATTGGIGEPLLPIISLGGALVENDPPLLASGAPSWGGAGGAGGASGCIPDTMTLREMIEACITDSSARDFFLGYLEASHPAWSPLIRDYFRCGTCGELADYIERCLYSDIRVQPEPPDGYNDLFDFCPPVMIYAGVRFT